MTEIVIVGGVHDGTEGLAVKDRSIEVGFAILKDDATGEERWHGVERDGQCRPIFRPGRRRAR